MGTRLVGRVPEVVALDRLLARAAGGRGAVVLLAGEAGIGKTALVEEAVARARGAGVTVLTGRADPDEGAPAFWPWQRLLESAPQSPRPAADSSAAEHRAAAVKWDKDEPPADGRWDLGPELLDVGERPGETSASARFRVVRAVVGALRAAGPLVLVLEDLHWADTASVALLRHLAADIGDVPLLVLGTVREPGGSFPLADFAGLPAAEVLTLAPLEPAAVSAYLSVQAGGPVHGSWVAPLHRLGGGNPLYLRELARLLAREDRLRRPAGDVDLPDGLRRLVARRTDQLSAPARDLLGGAAAIGAQIDVDILRAAAACPSDVDRLLAEAVDAGLLADDPWRPATLRFTHDLVRQARYGDLGRDERIGWHTRLAAALEAAGATAAEVARHRIRAAVDAGSRRTAEKACADAARAAARGLDHAEATRWYGRALEVAPGDPELLLARAGAAYADGQLDVALADCAATLDIAEAAARPDLAARAALVVRGVGGPLSAALTVLCERALALRRDDGDAEHAQLLAQYAFLLATSDDLARAEPISRRAMAMAEGSGDASALVAAVHARHEILDPSVDLDEIRDLAARVCDLAGPAGRPDAELWGRGWELNRLLTIGDLPGFDAELHRLAVLCDRLGRPMARWHLVRARAVRSLLAGHFAEAEAHAVEARDLGTTAQDETAYWLYLATSGAISAHTGDFPAWSAVRARTTGGDIDHPIAAAQVCRIAMQHGDREVAERIWPALRAALPGLAANGRWLFIVATAGELAAWLGDPEVVRACATRLRPFADIYLNSTTACYGAVARIMGIIASALGEHDEADRLLRRAIELEERIGAPSFAAIARLDHARALVARGAPGDHHAARRLAGQVVAAGRRMGMRQVTRAAAEIAGDDLTAREREIALLVADGLANRAIAAKLVLSERTVETHVRNVLAKLGLTNRTQLAARMRTPST